MFAQNLEGQICFLKLKKKKKVCHQILQKKKGIQRCKIVRFVCSYRWMLVEFDELIRHFLLPGKKRRIFLICVPCEIKVMVRGNISPYLPSSNCYMVGHHIYIFRTTPFQRGHLQVRLTFIVQTNMYYIQTF